MTNPGIESIDAGVIPSKRKADTMNLSTFRQLLLDAGKIPVRFLLPNGEMIPDHFHITEVGRVDKTFIDCGGTWRQSTACVLQAWTADDLDHRLDTAKLSEILTQTDQLFPSSDIPVELEYGSDTISRYFVTEAVLNPRTLTFCLEGKQTDCLAPEKCISGTC